MARHDRTPLRLLILVTPDFNVATTMAFVDPFRAANDLDGTRHFRWSFASEQGGDCPSSNGGAIATTPLAHVLRAEVDAVIVSSNWAPERHAAPVLRSALRRWGRHDVLLSGLDTGAFVLAQAGLLDGRAATVHYEHIDDL